MSDHMKRHPYRRLQKFDYGDAAHVFFVTACARENTTPFVDARLAQMVIDCLHWMRSDRGVRLYAFCLMPDHLHVLLQLGSSGDPLGSVVGSIKLFTTRASWDLGYTGQLWQGRFYDRVMRRAEDGRRMAQYILENPVRRGLVGEVEAYQWSGMPDPME